MKLLNIDELSQKTQRTVQIGGKEYKVYPVTVKAIVETTKRSKELQQNKDLTAEDYILQEMEMMIDLVQDCLPDVPRFELEKLTPELINKLTEFVRGQDDEVETEEISEGGKAVKK